MKYCVSLILLFFTIAGCDAKEPTESGASPETMVPTRAAVQQEVAEGVKSAQEDAHPRWKVDYTGDLKGSIEGEILTVMSVASSMIAVGAAMTPDHKGKAPQNIRLTIRNASSPKPSASVRLKLADGTTCSDDIASHKLSALNLLDGDKKTFHAELSGSLKCGAGARIDYTATLKKQP